MSRDVKVDLIKIEEIRDQYLSGEFDYEQKVELLCEINPEKDLEPEIIDTLILDGEISNLESYVTKEKASLIFDEVYMYYSDIPDEYIGYIPVTDLLEYIKENGTEDDYKFYSEIVEDFNYVENKYFIFSIY